MAEMTLGIKWILNTQFQYINMNIKIQCFQCNVCSYQYSRLFMLLYFAERKEILQWFKNKTWCALDL